VGDIEEGVKRTKIARNERRKRTDKNKQEARKTAYPL